MFTHLALATSLTLLSASAMAQRAEDQGITRLETLRLDGENIGLGPEISFAGGLILQPDIDGFGGWSAMEIETTSTPDELRLLAISDRGFWLTATLALDPNQTRPHLTGIGDMSVENLSDYRDGSSPEGITRDVDTNAYLVSFEAETDKGSREGMNRILSYRINEDWGNLSTVEGAPVLTFADGINADSGIEALTISGDHLWAGVERPEGRLGLNRLIAVRDFNTNAAEQDFELQVELPYGYGFKAMASDGADGLYILTTRFMGPRNCSNLYDATPNEPRCNMAQISHVDCRALENAENNGTVIVPNVLAHLHQGMYVDNFEALAVVQIENRDHLFILSDNNRRPNRQLTILLSFVLDPRPAVPDCPISGALQD